MKKGRVKLVFYVDDPDDKAEVLAALAGSDLMILMQEHRNNLKQLAETAESEELYEVYDSLIIALDDKAKSLGVSDLINPF